MALTLDVYIYASYNTHNMLSLTNSKQHTCVMHVLIMSHIFYLRRSASCLNIFYV
jgi:hypothetical protein